MAECHPVGFQWVAEAKARGARIIHVDPRFTRTSAVADKHIPIRAGSDVVLLGALIRHALETGTYFREYVAAYTNAPILLRGDYADPEDTSGLFSGFDTEVFFLPAASYAEKSGSFTQTQRLLQWRHAAVAPPGETDSELDFFYRLGLRLRELLADSDDPRDRPLLDLTWDYGLDQNPRDADPEKVLQEINGTFLTGQRAGEPLDTFTQMRADGSTAGGCWIYTGVYAGGINCAALRMSASDDDPLALEWGWAWPANRRILYNRASADPDGRPWSERKRHVWWSEDDEAWTGVDVPDFLAKLPPGHQPEPGATGVAALAGDDPFIMQPDGKGWLFAPTGLLDGPLPTHYDPLESPVPNLLYDQQHNPTALVIGDHRNLLAPDAPAAGAKRTGGGADAYPYAFTT